MKYKILIVLLILVIAELIWLDWIISAKYEQLDFPITGQLSAAGSILSALFAFCAIRISFLTWRNDKYLTYIQRLNETHEQAFKTLNEVLSHLKFTQYKNMGKEPYVAALDQIKKPLDFKHYKNRLLEYERFNYSSPYHLKLIRLLNHLEAIYHRLGFY
ncbi:hypothetical protein BKK49_10965 [Rodentibacter rarus]|uniref:hypothetical protein n=1 Tax=Rodentibacter rarus TaxID=1908260 RepID=UPI00098608B0|nr:hypothetical protein [Rodentibacter rarus]OOF37848.1 hypothetical protein BKK49_10965 [Rodentibacter rarus]